MVLECFFFIKPHSQSPHCISFINFFGWSKQIGQRATSPGTFCFCQKPKTQKKEIKGTRLNKASAMVWLLRTLLSFTRWPFFPQWWSFFSCSRVGQFFIRDIFQKLRAEFEELWAHRRNINKVRKIQQEFANKMAGRLWFLFFGLH